VKSILIKDRKREDVNRKGGGSMTTEAGIRIMQL
jgi:hypothetical protein